MVIPINGRRAGTANISKLSLQDVERIEIVRGPGSLVYGSQAIGGVVNLITSDGIYTAGFRGSAWDLDNVDSRFNQSAEASYQRSSASNLLAFTGQYQAHAFQSIPGLARPLLLFFGL